MRRLALVLSAAVALSGQAWGAYNVTLPALPPGHQPVTVVHTTDIYYAAWDWDDVVDATLLAATSPRDCSGMVFNVARGQRASLLELIQILSGLVGRTPKVVHGEPRPADVKHSEAEISRIEERLSFKPRVSLEEGLRRTVEWYRSRKGA